MLASYRQQFSQMSKTGKFFTVFIGLAILGQVMQLTAPDPVPLSPAEQRVRMEQSLEMGCGGYKGEFIQATLKDPESMQIIDRIGYRDGAKYIVNVTYRARNSFNGYVVDKVTCTSTWNGSSYN